MVEPTSSNEKSSAVEPFWMTLIWFWAFPVLATPWMPAHWLELSPVFDTLNDCLTSPLSASCALSWVITGAALLLSHQLLSSQWLLSHQRLLSQRSLARAGTASEATTSATTDASNKNFCNSSTSSSLVPTNYRKMLASRRQLLHPPKGRFICAQKDEFRDPKRILRSFTGRSQANELTAKRTSRRAGAVLFPIGGLSYSPRI